MKIGLKVLLYDEIQRRGSIRLEEAYQLTRDNGYDYDNCKRRMRELMEEKDGNEPDIAPIRNEKKIIIGYRFVGSEKPKVQIMKFPQLSIF
jgi:hypothetical protein